MSVQDEIPRSRLTLTYRTTISGEPATVELPFRMLVMGDFSLGSSVDRKADLEERRLRSVPGRNLDNLMKDMKMSLKLTVENQINPDTDGELEVDLPITSMKSFSPDEIANNVPRIRALLTLRNLLAELQSNIDNRKELRKLIQDLYSKPELVEAMRKQLKDYESLKLPARATAAQ